MRFIVALSALVLAASHSMAVEKPQYNHLKEQWVVITRPIIGCDSIEDIDWSAKVAPILHSDAEAAKPVRKWTTSCYVIKSGSQYFLDKPKNSYTVLVSLVCPHCAPYAEPTYTKANGKFYEKIPEPEFYKEFWKGVEQ